MSEKSTKKQARGTGGRDIVIFLALIVIAVVGVHFYLKEHQIAPLTVVETTGTSLPATTQETSSLPPPVVVEEESPEAIPEQTMIEEPAKEIESTEETIPEEPAPVIEQPAVAPENDETITIDVRNPGIVLRSSVMKEGRRIPLNHTCYWENTSPPLSWSNIPEGTKSFVITMERREDGKKPFLNWLAYNIAGDRQSVPVDMAASSAAEGGALGLNGHGSYGYAGPCEPKGTYPYVYTIYALDTVLDLPDGASYVDVTRAMDGHVLDTGALRVNHYFRM
ncbi:MAG: YbhB/YbcL family Raf kinase inhibitor-like protein [Rhodospirillales bacterium]|nr:YbhB/YbcL family Raf kinase inhibitor-like protein [Rhodospirillales bacterium]